MEKITYISFPGLNINEFAVNNVAFTILGKSIMWYGIIITLGIVLAFCYVMYRAKKTEYIKTDDVLDYAICLVISGIVGARLYYVFTKFDTFKGDTLKETLRNIIAIWEGGIGIYGAIIAGFFALVAVSKIKKIKVGKALDMISPAVMLGQLIGRWGNFFNAEAYGSETSLPWRMGLRAASESNTIYVHPTFLYESLWNLIGFIIINIIYKKKKFDGQVCVLYVTWYGFGRMFIEQLRTDSLYIGNFKISQVIGFLSFVFGIIFLSVKLTLIKNSECKNSDSAAISENTTPTNEIESNNNTVLNSEDN